MKHFSGFRPTLHNSLVQGIHWANFGLIFVFASIYMLDHGLTNNQIGLVIACGSTLSAILQPILGFLADRSKKFIHRKLIVIIASLIILLCLLLFIPEKSALSTALLYGLLIAFVQLITPLSYSISTFFAEKGLYINFGISRGTGSLTYALVSAVFGVLVEKMGTHLIPLAILFTSLLLIVLVLTYRFDSIDENSQEHIQNSSNNSIFTFISDHKQFLLVLLGLSLLFVSYNMISSFTYQIFEYLGYGSDKMGIAVSIAAVVELPTLFLLSGINRKFRSGFLLKVSSVFIFLKIFLIYLAKGLPLIWIAMSTQILGYALFAGISVYYVMHTIDFRNQSLGQSLMTVTVTIGSILGSLLGGAILDKFSVPAMLLTACIFALIGSLVICLFTEKGKYANYAFLENS